jgi:LuxR family transcriptional regulator, maltose regulon positive regulatory protein
MGILVDQADELRARLSRKRGSGDAGAVTLTAAELRLPPLLLTTHLSIPEIAAELFVSPNTAKTHAVSIYRKLGTSTRTQAVTRAWELGLLARVSPASHPFGGYGVLMV